MPSTTTREIPREVKEMPSEIKKIWMAAFKRALKESPEDMAGHIAMAAVKKLFTRVENDEGEEEWVAKEEAAEAREEEVAEAVRVAKGGDPDDPEDDPDEGGSKEERKGKRAVEEDPEFEKATNVIKAARAIQSAAGTTDSVELTETLMLDAKGFRLTQDGFLVAEPRVARTGIQIYKGWEVGRPDMDDVHVYRPESEVFDQRAMSTLAYRTITLEHPDAKVDATNWKELAVGHSGGTVARDGDFVRVPLVLMDAAAIQAAQEGVSQLSVGYGAKLQWGDGVTKGGERYHAKQTEIRANHIALVTAARGGDKLKIGDKKAKQNGQQRSKAMTERTLTIDGVSITLEDKDSQILERHLAAMTRRLQDQDEEIAELEKKTGEIESELEETKKDASTKDGEIAALRQKLDDGKLTPDKLDKALNLRMEVVDRANSFFGDAAKYVWQGKTDAQIRRDVVAARMGEQQSKSMNDSMIEGAFLSITEPEPQDGFQRMTQSFSRPPVSPNYNDAAAKAYDKRNEELQNRHLRNRRPVGGPVV